MLRVDTRLVNGRHSCPDCCSVATSAINTSTPGTVTAWVSRYTFILKLLHGTVAFLQVEVVVVFNEWLERAGANIITVACAAGLPGRAAARKLINLKIEQD